MNQVLTGVSILPGLFWQENWFGYLAAPERKLIYNKGESTIIMVNDIIHKAIRLRASDIHCEPFEKEMAIRFRVDGVLQEMASIPADRTLETVSQTLAKKWCCGCSTRTRCNRHGPAAHDAVHHPSPACRSVLTCQTQTP